MKGQYLRILESTFKDPAKITPANLKSFLDETETFFRELQEKSKSDVEGARKEAEEMAMEVKEFLEGQMERIVASSGFDPEEFMTSIADPSKMSEQDRETLSEIKERLQSVHHDSSPVRKRKKGKKGKQLRLLG